MVTVPDVRLVDQRGVKELGLSRLKLPPPLLDQLNVVAPPPIEPFNWRLKVLLLVLLHTVWAAPALAVFMEEIVSTIWSLAPGQAFPALAV